MQKKVKIAFAGRGLPLVKLIALALTLKKIEVCAVFIPKKELNFFRSKLHEFAELWFEDILHITRDRVKDMNLLKDHDYLISYNNTEIIEPRLIQNLNKGGLNFHAGSLPEYAGSYTYQWAIMNNEPQFAATIHWIEGKTDEGPVILKKEFPVSSKETGISLLMKSVYAAHELMTILLNDIAEDKALLRCDQELSKRKFYSMAAIQTAGLIDWNRSAAEIDRLVRAASFFPLPSPTYEPFTFTRLGKIIIHKAKIDTTQGLNCNPGEVLGIDGGGVTIKTGNNTALLLTSLSIDNHKYTCGNMLASGIKTGDLFYGGPRDQK